VSLVSCDESRKTRRGYCEKREEKLRGNEGAIDENALRTVVRTPARFALRVVFLTSSFFPPKNKKNSQTTKTDMKVYNDLVTKMSEAPYKPICA